MLITKDKTRLKFNLDYEKVTDLIQLVDGKYYLRAIGRYSLETPIRIFRKMFEESEYRRMLKLYRIYANSKGIANELIFCEMIQKLNDLHKKGADITKFCDFTCKNFINENSPLKIKHASVEKIRKYDVGAFFSQLQATRNLLYTDYFTYAFVNHFEDISSLIFKGGDNVLEITNEGGSLEELNLFYDNVEEVLELDKSGFYSLKTRRKEQINQCENSSSEWKIGIGGLCVYDTETADGAMEEIAGYFVEVLRTTYF